MSKRVLTPGTFAFVPSALAADPDLGRPGLRVGCLMASHADSNGRCWMSSETMARKLRCVRSMVQVGLAQLLARGHAVKQERPGRTSIYQLIFRHPDELGDRVRRSRDEGSRQSNAADKVTVSRDHEVTGFPEAGDCTGQSGVTVPDGRNQYDSEKKDRDDEAERARARPDIVGGWSAEEAAATAAACRSFDELADRKGWPSETRPLIQYERSRLYVRLDECGGLDGWRVAIAEAERSAYLARQQPNLRSFLDDKPFWKWMHRRQAAKPASPAKPIAKVASQVSAGLGQEGEVSEIEIGRGAAPSREAPPASQSPPPALSPAVSIDERPHVAPAPRHPPPPQPRPDQLAAELAVVKVVSKVTTEQMDAEMQKWRGQLAAAGFGEAETTACLVEAARRVPKTPYAFIGMGERVAKQVQRALNNQPSS